MLDVLIGKMVEGDNFVNRENVTNCTFNFGSPIELPLR